MLQHFWGAKLSNDKDVGPINCRRLSEYVRPAREHCRMFTSGSMGPHLVQRDVGVVGTEDAIGIL